MNTKIEYRLEILYNYADNIYFNLNCFVTPWSYI